MTTTRWCKWINQGLVIWSYPLGTIIVLEQYILLLLNLDQWGGLARWAASTTMTEKNCRTLQIIILAWAPLETATNQRRSRNHNPTVSLLKINTMFFPNELKLWIWSLVTTIDTFFPKWFNISIEAKSERWEPQTHLQIELDWYGTFKANTATDIWWFKHEIYRFP